MLTFRAMDPEGRGARVDVNPALVAAVVEVERYYVSGSHVRCAEIHLSTGTSIVVIDHAGNVADKIKAEHEAPRG